MPKKTFGSITYEARTKRSEKCSFSNEHNYEFLFLHLFAQEDSYTVLRCGNCGEIIKERVVDSEKNVVMN